MQSRKSRSTSDVLTKHIEHDLPEYLAGTLSDWERFAVEEHLKGCSSCKSQREELQQTLEMLGGHKAPRVPDGYFSAILPRVRARLEGEESRSFYTHPLLTRLALPLGAAALVLLISLSVPFPAIETGSGANSLQAEIHGTTTDELVDVVFDMMQSQPLSSPTDEAETSSLVGLDLLRSEHLLANVDEASIAEDLMLNQSMLQELERLDHADLEILVQRLGERTTL
jgi:hypothetical protein